MDENVNVPAETAPETSAPDVSTENSQAPATPAPSENRPSGDIRLKVNPETGEREIEYGEIKQEQQQETPQEPPAPQYYSDTELLQAISNNNVLAGRISPEQQQFIQNQQAYFMRQAQEQQKQAEMQQYIQQNAQKLMADSLAGVDGIAKQKAMQAAGLTADDLENIEFIENSEQKKAAYKQAYDNAYAEAAYNIAQQNIQKAQQMQQFQNGMMEIGNFVRNEQLSEPKCNEIMKLMDTAMQEMPYNKAIKYNSAWRNMQNGICTQQDLASIREYYDECKKMVYQQSVGVPKVPQRVAVPKVETSGQPSPQAKQPMDFSKLRGMSQHDRDAAVMQFLGNL